MRLSPSPAAGLVAAHAALTTGIHGVTGTLCGTSDAQTLTNKTIGAGGLTFDNEGAGDNCLFSSDSGTRQLTLLGQMESSGQLMWKSHTAFVGTLDHGISVARTWVLPDVAGNILIDADTDKLVTFTRVTVLNVGAGANPYFASDSASQEAVFTGVFVASNIIESSQNFRFKSGTAFRGTFDHAISEVRTWTFPDITGTVCMWDAANAAVTRHWSIGAYGLLAVAQADNTKLWTLDTANGWIESTTVGISYFGINLPHGAIVTALRVTMQDTGASALHVALQRATQAAGAVSELATRVSSVDLAESSDTTIDNATIDNDTYYYFLELEHADNALEVRLVAVQIDYTVTEPYP